MLESIIGPLKAWAEFVVHALGYPGIILLMMLDSINIPIPSEVIMPTGGVLAAQGKLLFWAVGLAGTVGTFVGSCINYWLGFKLGKEGLAKYGKYLFIRQKEIEHGDVWFDKYGGSVTLWGRFIPMVRTFISLPAGIYRMNFRIFAIYALIGATVWSYLWAYIGFKLQENYVVIERNWKYVDLAAVLLFVVLLVRWIISRRREKLESASTELI